MICAGLTREQSNDLYLDVLSENDTKALRQLCQNDLFFLSTIAFKRKDINKDWLYERCREVEKSPDGHLDLWAREHYKSTIITFAKSIQDILKNPEITIGIFSHTRPIAKDFLKQIKNELERNEFLKSLFPDVLYQNPEKQSPKWSLDTGIRVKRQTNPKEETVEAWGVVDGQPTGKHFMLLVYDDIVTRESVTTSDQIKKTTEALGLSYNLGAHGGTRRFIGTRYHMSDTYRTIIDRGTVSARIHPATDNGSMDGNPVFLTKEQLLTKRRDMGPYIFGTQMLQDPVADKSMGFKKEWLKSYQKLSDISSWNKYILVDPASKKKSTSDYTVMNVIGLAPDGNYYLIDAIRDRLNLTQRASKLFDFHQKYKPISVGYEQYGMQSDIEHIKYEMELRNYRFNIIEIGGSIAKEDRIKRLVPICEQGRFYLPETLHFVNYEAKVIDYVHEFIENEYTAFPVCVHDDMLDCLARIVETNLGATFPTPDDSNNDEQRPYDYGSSTGWMS